MIIPSFLRNPLIELVHEIVRGNYDLLERDGRIGRLSADELKRAVQEYGCTIIELPEESFQVSEAYPINNEIDTWAIDLNLWTAEEGRSDLTLQVTARLAESQMVLAIDDLRVL